MSSPAAPRSGRQRRRISPPIFLLKTPSSPRDMYKEYFLHTVIRTSSAAVNTAATVGSGEDAGVEEAEEAEYVYKPIFVPVLSHRMHSANHSLLRSFFVRPHDSQEVCAFVGKERKYGGIIFTSQRAVEAFGHVLANGDVPVEVSRNMTLYTVGPATTRLLTPLRDKYMPFAEISGEHTGNGNNLAAHILEHYNSPIRATSADAAAAEAGESETGGSKPGLLFLVGEQRRDVIPKTLMSESLDEHDRIQVDELVVYETTEMAGFEASFRDAVAQGETELASLTHDNRRKNEDGSDDDGLDMWVVIFSPTGCDSVLRTLNRLPSSTDTNIQVAGQSQTRRRRAKRCLIATIGPTTRDYLSATYGVVPDVVAETPSPEGVGDAIRKYYG